MTSTTSHPRGGLSPEEAARALERIRRLARLLDSAFQVPGTRFRFGIDPLLGLVPGLGDVAAAAIALGLLAEARRLGAPRSVLLRMVGNVAVDTVFGSIPVAGSVFDFFYRANERNRRLLEEYLLRAGGGPVIDGVAHRID